MSERAKMNISEDMLRRGYKGEVMNEQVTCVMVRNMSGPCMGCGKQVDENIHVLSGLAQLYCAACCPVCRCPRYRDDS